MTIYELMKSIEPSKLSALVGAGIIPPEWKRAVSVYEHYLKLCSTHGKMDSYDLTGERFFMSDENVRRIVRKMKREV